MRISEVSAAGNKTVESDMGNTDIAAAAGSLAAGGMGMDFEAEEGRCGSSERGICATLFCN
jgi:hypothetical protein